MSSQSRDKIAIIGIAGRFPGAPDVETFWDNLQQGVNSIREVPFERWDVNQYYSPDMKRPNTSNSKWCGIVDGVDQFDHRFFNISAREANNMDPQQRMLLQETWHCIEDAGVNPKQLSEQTTGVYVGVMANDYGQEAAHPERTVDPYAGLGNYANVLSNRLSYFLGTHGPSSTINAACASSLVAIHEAKRTLQSGECRYALAAGVNLNLTPWKHISFGRSRMLSPDGQCKTFDAEANGYVPGDGVAVVLMQSLSEALAEGNPIYGVVRASGINHNGLNASITAPNVEAQQRLIESCYREAGFSPETVGYIEAHGTGTSLGDPIEVEALTRAFSGYTDKQGFCHIGSVKSNIGHLEGAAGIAGVIKVLLMMRHRRIPRTLNIKTLNPIINFEQSPFIPAMEPVEWESSDQAPLRAGVSSFGFGGVNSHLLLEEAPQQRDTAHGPRTEEIGGFPFMLSAVTPDALRQLHAKWCQWEEVVSHPQPQELCATLACGRAGLPLRYSAWLEQWSDPESALSGEPPTEKTVSHERWELLLGDLRWRGWGELSDSLQQQISAHLLSPSHVIDENEGSEPGRCMALLQSESWSENCIPLYSFMVGHAALQGIEQAGFLPERVSCAKGGGWLALVRSGVVEVNDALAVLAGKREIESLSLKRPQLDFMNPVGQELEPPLRLSVSYLKGVFESALADVEREHLKFHFDKAKQLYKNQYTFKRHLHEWDEVLQEPLGRSTEQLLEDERVIDDPSLRLLLMTIVISSLRMLNRKWNLADLAEVGDEAFRELNDLLLDEVLERKQVVELLLDKSTDLDAVVEGMSRRHGHLDQSRPYAALRAQSSVFDGIDNLKTWLAEMPESQAATPERMGRLVIGAAKERDTDIATGFEKGIAPVLLLLWQQGVDIDWSVIYPPGSFQKQSIPRYPFTTRRFWLEAVNHLEPQSATTLPTPQSKSINQQSVTDGGVLGQLIQILATQLDMDESDLDGFTSLQEYGLDDRVVATEFCGIINNRWNVAFNSVNLKVDDDLNHLASQLAKLPLVAQAMEQQAALQPQYSTDSLMGPLCYWLLNRLNEVLGEDTNLDPQSDIRDFGMDSIALTSYAERIDGQIDIHFDPALLMQLNTIEEIAEYLLKRSSKAVMELPGITDGMLSSEPAPTTPLSEEADLQPQVSVAPQAATLFESPTKQEEIVIVGISGRFPGADNLDEYWSNLLEQRDCVSEIPLRRWDWRKYYTAPGEAREGTVSKWSGLLDEIDRFDAEFFDISAHEAELMDPQQRLLLEESWHAIEDAGYRPSSFAGSRTGVFVGVCNEDYSELVQHSESAQDAFASTGEYFAIIPNRISYQFDLRGPSYAFDAACSSSLVAFYNAIQAIRNQDCDHALVGGVNICLSPRRYVYFSQAGLLSPQGRCKTFDEGADGYVRGEGVGVALLKRRSQAEADGDRIYAVIKDVAINHGGTANALTAPNPKAQATLIADAYRRADVSPESVGYIEVHGTGTKIGDSVEVNGLKLAFSDLMNGETVGSPSGWCGLGSVKSNIGHLESASGMASVFKVLLAMQHATLPATLHLQQLSDYIQLEETPFRIVDKQQPWSLLADRNGASLPRRAGVSGFGFGGGNAHIVLEQYTAQTMTESQGDYLFVLSAHSAEQLQTQALNLLHWIRQTGQNVSPAAIAWTLQRGREETGYRLAVSADQLEQLAAKLQRFTIQKQGSKGIHMGRVESGGEQTSLRLDGEAGRAFLEVSVKTRELDKLAGLWVQGVEIDWRLLYPGGIPTPVSLPGYPFARQSHWIADIREEPQPETAAEEDIPDEQLSMWYEQRNEEGERMPAFLQLLKIKG